VQVWDRTRLVDPVRDSAARDSREITALAFDPRTTNTLALGFVNGTVQIRDSTDLDRAPRTSAVGNTAVLALAFDPRNPPLLVSAGADGSASIWNSTDLRSPLRSVRTGE
jgi:WD40 repeat protein